MTHAGQPQLLSIDEACNLIGSSAIALVDAIGEPSERLPYLLSGRGTLRGLSAPAATAARTYRAALRHVRSVGLGWVIPDQVEGALSYAGLETDVALNRAA
jgi:hypothetical protein